MITVNRLYYKYRGNEKATLQDVSFTVQSGEVVVVVGGNGAGKSTLARLVAGITKPQRLTRRLPQKRTQTKHLEVDGYDMGLRQNQDVIFKKVGIVFQNPETQILFRTFEDEMNFILKGKPLDKDLANATLARVGLNGALTADLSNFSLGQKQRAVIAETLIRDPKYLVFDEPTAMIDTIGKQQIRRLMRELRDSGKGILLFTNSPEEILVADRILVLQDGKIVLEVKIEDLCKKYTLLRQYHVAMPPLVELVRALHESGLELHPKNWGIKTVAEEILSHAT